MGGASDSGEVDVQGASLLDSEEVSAPGGVLARSVFTPELVCLAPALPEKEKVSGEVWLVCAQVLLPASEEIQVGVVESREEALGPAWVERSKEAGFLLMVAGV